MKTLNDLREYAKAKEMNESDIERLIDELESDGNGYITDEVCTTIFATELIVRQRIYSVNSMKG